jgi:hypothetical protein
LPPIGIEAEADGNQTRQAGDAHLNGFQAPRITLRQKLTPDRLQSRVNTAGRMLSFGLGWPLGALAGGVVAQALGPRGALLGSVAILLTGTIVAWLSPLRTTTSLSPRGGRAA